MLRFLLWRTLALLAGLVSFALLLGLLDGSIGRTLRHADPGAGRIEPGAWLGSITGDASRLSAAAPRWLEALAALLSALGAIALALVLASRHRSRGRRSYERLRLVVYRTDMADAGALSAMFAAMHAGLAVRWWRRLLHGQPSLALEVHHRPPGAERPAEAWLAVTCPRGRRELVESALRGAYPNLRLAPDRQLMGAPPVVLRLKKHSTFIRRTRTGSESRFDGRSEPMMDRLITMMAACRVPAVAQIALTPAPASLERVAKHLYKHHEARLSRERQEHLLKLDRSMVEDTELRGGLEVQHASLFFADIRVIAPLRSDCERIASVLRTQRAENRLVERGTGLRHNLLGLYARRVERGEGNPAPGISRGVFAPAELAELWQLPSVDYSAVPFSRSAIPIAPAPPEVFRPGEGRGMLRDALGPVSIHVELRRQNIAVPGTVEQGKSSLLVASVAEDLRRDRCAVIVLDPKGDAADAALSAVPPERTCTLLDFARPTCGFNPLAVDAPADVIADYVVAALRNLFTDADIRASSDRYLRNAIIAVLSFDRHCTLWDAARLLSVGEEGYAYRRAVGSKLRELPELKEISSFFADELAAQLADARSATTSKLDAPVNKLARLLNSASIKRVLLNDSLRVDLDQVIAGAEVLVVKGALGSMGAGNTSVLMQLLVGMLDAALARQQDLVQPERRTAVALKIDEAPIVLNRGFAETMALKRSAGLETVACWQTDSQWTDPEVRDQLDALFAHRVYFATASARDARAAVALTMAEFSDTVRPGIARLSSLGRPDVRLRLPRHSAIASWSTPEGRQAAFVAHTIPMQIDRERLALHAAAQSRRGGRPMEDLRQPHWQRRPEASGSARERASEGLAPGPGTSEQERAAPPTLPSHVAESFRELLELDRASSVRAAPRGGRLEHFRPDPRDIEILALIATFGHVLSSQIHRRFNAGRSPTTTQRRLKRLADAGLVDRFQFHRPDGGGVPMCYRITPDGRWALDAGGHPAGALGLTRAGSPGHVAATGAAEDLRQVRHELHAAGWALAAVAVEAASELHGPEESVLVPPSPGSGRRMSPSDLRLPGGRVPHDFVRRSHSGDRLEVERFDTVRPDGRLVLATRDQGRLLDMLIELDDRAGHPAWAAKLERYDHFLTGWSLHLPRYGTRGKASPIVVFLCRDRSRARECARHADALLLACRAYPGEYPSAWDYTGRRLTLFAAERDLHEGLPCAWGVPALPPAVRAGDGVQPEAGEATALARRLPIVVGPAARPGAASRQING